MVMKGNRQLSAKPYGAYCHQHGLLAVAFVAPGASISGTFAECLAVTAHKEHGSKSYALLRETDAGWVPAYEGLVAPRTPRRGRTNPLGMAAGATSRTLPLAIEKGGVAIRTPLPRVDRTVSSGR